MTELWFEPLTIEEGGGTGQEAEEEQELWVSHTWVLILCPNFAEHLSHTTAAHHNILR